MAFVHKYLLVRLFCFCHKAKKQDSAGHLSEVDGYLCPCEWSCRNTDRCQMYPKCFFISFTFFRYVCSVIANGMMQKETVRLGIYCKLAIF